MIDIYDATAKINYIGTAEPPPPIEIKNASERSLTFSYDRLGYIKVDVQAGDIDWTQIKDVFVDLDYPSAPNEPDAKATVHLTQGALTGKWICSKHGAASNMYRYAVRYIYADGREVAGVKDQRDNRGTLVVHDQLIGKLRRTFEVVMDPQTVDSVSLKVRYQDGPNPVEETRKAFTATGTWEYVRPLTDGSTQDLEYSYQVAYDDGQFAIFPSTHVGPHDDLPPIQARRFKFSVGIDGGGIDWEKWRTVLVHLEYTDNKHNFLQINDVSVTKEAPTTSVEIQAFSVGARAYAYRAVFVPRRTVNNPVVHVPGPETLATASGTLLLETLVP